MTEKISKICIGLNLILYALQVHTLSVQESNEEYNRRYNNKLGRCHRNPMKPAPAYGPMHAGLIGDTGRHQEAQFQNKDRLQKFGNSHLPPFGSPPSLIDNNNPIDRNDHRNQQSTLRLDNPTNSAVTNDQSNPFQQNNQFLINKDKANYKNNPSQFYEPSSYNKDLRSFLEDQGEQKPLSNPVYNNDGRNNMNKDRFRGAADFGNIDFSNFHCDLKEMFPDKVYHRTVSPLLPDTNQQDAPKQNHNSNILNYPSNNRQPQNIKNNHQNFRPNNNDFNVASKDNFHTPRQSESDLFSKFTQNNNPTSPNLNFVDNINKPGILSGYPNAKNLGKLSNVEFTEAQTSPSISNQQNRDIFKEKNDKYKTADKTMDFNQNNNGVQGKIPDFSRKFDESNRVAPLPGNSQSPVGKPKDPLGLQFQPPQRYGEHHQNDRTSAIGEKSFESDDLSLYLPKRDQTFPKNIADQLNLDQKKNAGIMNQVHNTNFAPNQRNGPLNDADYLKLDRYINTEKSIPVNKAHQFNQNSFKNINPGQHRHDFHQPNIPFKKCKHS